MPRQRYIHPQIWNSDQFCSLTDGARLLFIGIISTSDDEGRRRASIRSIKGDIYPQDDSRSLDMIEVDLASIIKAGLVRVYRVESTEYLDIPTWKNYQRPKYPSPSRIPAFPERSPRTGGGLGEPSRNVPPRVGRSVGLGDRSGDQSDRDGGGAGGDGTGGSVSPPAPASQDHAPGRPLSPESEGGGGKDFRPQSLREIIDAANGKKGRKETPQAQRDREEARIAELRRQAAQIQGREPEEDLTGFEPPPVDISGQS